MNYKNVFVFASVVQVVVPKMAFGGGATGCQQWLWWGCALVQKVTFGGGAHWYQSDFWRASPKHKSLGMLYQKWLLAGVRIGTKSGFWWGCALVPKVTFGGGAHWFLKSLVKANLGGQFGSQCLGRVPLTSYLLFRKYAYYKYKDEDYK